MTSTFYPPYHLGGDATHVKYLAEELVKIGHEVHVFYSKDAYMIKRRNLPKITESQGVFTNQFESRLNFSPYFVYLFGNSPEIIRKFNLLVKEIRPDVVHHHNISLLGYRIFSSSSSCLNLYTAHDYWLICSQNNFFINGTRECTGPSCITCALRRKRLPQLWRYTRGFKKALNKIDLVIAPSNYIQERLTEQINNKSVVISNFVPYPPKNISQASYSNYYLFVGLLEKHKGIINLIKIFCKSHNKIGAKLLIVGNGSLKTYIQHYIRQYSLDNFILFIGSVSTDKLYSLYKGACALIVPSIWPETSSLVVMEALSVGTPAIVSNMGALPEIMRKVDNSLIFTNFDELENILINFPKNNIDKNKVTSIYGENFSPKVYLDRYIKSIEALQ